MGWWRYRIPGLGQVEFGRYVDTLYEGGFDGVLSVEHEDPVWGGSLTWWMRAFGSPTTTSAGWWCDDQLWDDVEKRVHCHEMGGAMIGTIVSIGPSDTLDRSRASTVAEKAGPVFEGMPGLRSKVFMWDEQAATVTNVYVWQSEEAAGRSSRQTWCNR